MAGAPSQLDLFDPKPKLQQLDGTSAPDEIVKGERFAFIRGTPEAARLALQVRAARRSRARRSRSCCPTSASVADDIAIVRSLHTSQFNHAPAQIFMNTGHQIVGRPSMGSWLTYGLGSENADLPGFVVLLSGENQPDGGKSCWGSGFLPSGVPGRASSARRAIRCSSCATPRGSGREDRRASLDTARAS